MPKRYKRGLDLQSDEPKLYNTANNEIVSVIDEDGVMDFGMIVLGTMVLDMMVLDTSPRRDNPRFDSPWCGSPWCGSPWCGSSRHVLYTKCIVEIPALSVEIGSLSNFSDKEVIQK
jgi:hypothetical protein